MERAHHHQFAFFKAAALPVGQDKGVDVGAGPAMGGEFVPTVADVGPCGQMWILRGQRGQVRVRFFYCTIAGIARDALVIVSSRLEGTGAWQGGGYVDIFIEGIAGIKQPGHVRRGHQGYSHLLLPVDFPDVQSFCEGM